MKIRGVYYALGKAGTENARRRYADLLARNAAGTLEAVAKEVTKPTT